MATATVVPGSIVLEVLNQDNYEQWSFRVKTYLLAKDLWDIVEAPTQEFGEGVGDKVWTKKNAEALYAIQISCGTNTTLDFQGAGAPSLLLSHPPHISYDCRSLSNAPEHRPKPTTKRPCSSGREPDGRDQFISRPQSFD
ncbi:hypothetical protein CerSpe_241770 [Prunus speciosa]